MPDLDKLADGPAMVAAGRTPSQARAEATGPHDITSWGLFSWSSTCCSTTGGGRGRHREGVAALPRGRRGAAGGARVVARDERGDGRPEVLRPARDVAARLAAGRLVRRVRLRRRA